MAHAHDHDPTAEGKPRFLGADCATYHSKVQSRTVSAQWRAIDTSEGTKIRNNRPRVHEG
jgi:hypothetical protein